MRIWTVAASDGTPFAQKYWLSPTGSLKNEQYPHVLQMSSQEHTVNTLADLHGLVTSVATQGAALVKGELLRDLVDEKRAGATSPSPLTQWVCLDFDGFLVQGQAPPSIRRCSCWAWAMSPTSSSTARARACRSAPACAATCSCCWRAPSPRRS